MRVVALRTPGDRETSASPAPEVAAAAAGLRRGNVVVFPTETFYALGADPRSPAGTALVFRLKRRPADRPLPWIAASLEQVEAVCRLNPAARALGDRYWPGPLTLVLPRRGGLPRRDGLPRRGREEQTAAVRVSSHPAARALAAALGHPVISTSANRSGRPPAVTVEEVAASLGAAARSVTALDGGRTPGGAPSVIVDARGPELRVLRGTLESLAPGS